jgi:DtxR family Mn-dependent transcriptional regulator
VLAAKMIVRNHREVFSGKIRFSWDEVHEIAEQLEHIKSEKLINKLDDFLETPPKTLNIQFHAKGQVLKIEKQLLSELAENQKGICVG